MLSSNGFQEIEKDKMTDGQWRQEKTEMGMRRRLQRRGRKHRLLAGPLPESRQFQAKNLPPIRRGIPDRGVPLARRGTRTRHRP